MSKLSIWVIVLVAALSPLSSLAADAPAINLRRTTTVDVVDKTKDAVVYISSKKTMFVSAFPNDPFWRDFGQMRTGNSLGSGFIVHPDGYIITNNHVIDRTRQINVELLDGRKFEADLVSANPQSDLAVLKINADKPLPTLELGDSSDLMIGEPVIAVGNPLGFSHTVSTGIVSAIHRDLTTGGERVQLQDLIQTDAAINPGNSGGPLLNAYGQVIGIDTAIRADAQNLGFAIQVNRLREMIPALMNPGQANKLEIPLKLTERRTLTPPATVTATILQADGDVPVLSIAGVKPRDIIDAYAILLRQKENVPFEVTFEGKPSMKITPTPLPLPDAVVKAKQKLGLTVEPITPMLAERLGLGSEDGIHIIEVARGSVADRAKLQPNDIILQLGNYRIANLKDFAVLLEHLPDSGDVSVGVMRGAQTGFLTLKF